MTVRKFRKEQATRLRSIASVLEHAGVCLDVGPLRSAASRCQRTDNLGPDKWGYDLIGLRLPVDTVAKRHIIPSGAAAVQLELGCHVIGIFPPNGSIDPFEQLNVDLELTGQDHNGLSLFAAWHLDRHTPGDVEPLSAHPHYHFQHGGRALRSRRETHDFGSSLILGPPRLAHPPLDAVLAVDFALSNFAPMQWRRLRESERAYKDAIRENQNVFWQRYALGTSAYWTARNTCQLWQGAGIWPQLV